MNIKNSLHALLTAALTSLIVLGVPDGHAEIQAPLSGYVIPQTIEPDPFSPASSMAATSTSTPRTRAMTVMGDSPLPPVPDKTAQRFRQVDAGGSATCGILQGSGKLLCWGRNDLGQASPPIGKYRFVAMGENHGCAVTEKGLLRCWGVPSAYPTAQQAKGRFLSVAAGDDHTCALRRDKTVACWGNNDNGELDAPNGKFLQVVARGDHSCGVTTGKRLICWGEESFTGYTQLIHTPVKKVATGQLHACVLKQDGQAVCWGNRINGQTQPPADRFIDIVAGDWHTCGLRADHTALCWGRDQYGQTQVGMDKYRLIAGGGMQTCGILRGSQQVTCHGSFANNELLYPQDPDAQLRASQADGQVRPQLAFLAFYQGISGLLSAGLVNTGKMVDQKMEKWEGRMVPVQLSLLFVNMFLGWFLPKPEDPMLKIIPILEDIQADIKKLEHGMSELNKKMTRVEVNQLKSWCDQRLEEYNEAFVLLEGPEGGSTTGARRAYAALLKKQEAVLTQSIDQKRNVPFPAAELKEFRDKYLDQIISARTKLSTSLTGANGVQTPAFSSCFEKGYADFKANVASEPGAYPFDDRLIYNHIFPVLAGATQMQAEMLLMEEDVEMQAAYQKLVEPRPDGEAPIIFDPEEHAMGFCLYADERKNTGHAEYSPRWSDVAAICQKNREKIQNAYIDLVRQFESVGSAYSDDQVVLSLTSEQMGLPKVSEKERNWLWLRNIPDEDAYITSTTSHGTVTGKWQDLKPNKNASPFLSSDWTSPIDLKSDAALYFRNRGNWNAVYKDPEKFDQGVWHSNGEAWDDIHAFRVARRKASNVEGTQEDLMARMHELVDMTSTACKRDTNGNCMKKIIGPGQEVIIDGPQLPLFTGVNSDYVMKRYRKVFWMGGKTFTYDARSKLDIPHSWTNENTKPKRELKCFLARDINRHYEHTGAGGNIINYFQGTFIPQSVWPSSVVSDWDDNMTRVSVSGKVCTTEEMGAVLTMVNDAYREVPEIMKPYRPCSTMKTRRGGNGKGYWDLLTLCSQFGLLSGHENTDYRPALGFMVAKATYINEMIGYNDWFRVDTWIDEFKPNTDGNLYHMPVVNINDRQCKTNMIAGLGYRNGFRMAGNVKIPSICSEDLDKLIGEVIPRPEFPEVPENIVRKPEY